MSTAVAQRLSKPDWNNFQRRTLYKQIYAALATGFASSIAAYFLWYVPKWRAIEEYEKNYDPWAEMERMRNLGLFQSAPPDYIIEEQKKKALAKKKK